MTTHKVDTYLNLLRETSDYQDLFSKISELNKIQQAFSTISPPYLAKLCALSLPVNGKVTVFAVNGSIATKLKQILPSLLFKMQALGWEVSSIQIATQVIYPTNDTDRFPQKKRKLSQCGTESLTQLAASLPESALRIAVERLLKNG